MNNGPRLFLISILIASLALSQSATAPQNGSAQTKTAPKKTAAQKSTAQKSSAQKSPAAAAPKSSTTASTKKGKSSKKSVKTASTWRNRQLTPAPERYREIQQALADKGYLKSEPNGVWDAQSIDALSRFQADQKLTPTGKINSTSLIGLGLGPKNSPSEVAAAPGSTDTASAPPPSN